MSDSQFPEGWTAGELTLILATMQNLPTPGNELQPVIVDRGEPGERLSRDLEHVPSGPLVGSFHWSDRDYQWRFVPAWRPGELP